GAEAGIVTSGASAAMLLGAAACLAGLDPGRMNRLPEVADGRREFIAVRSQRNMYDRALMVAGAHLVEVGIPDRYSGPGVRDAAAWEIEDAIGPHTAGIYYLAQARSLPDLPAVVEVARRHRLPVLVDAAAQLPPVANLRTYIAQGATLVAFSGGKAIGGPQASGILCGQADLVCSALIQMLDMDVFSDVWSAPGEFSRLAQLRGLPRHGVGRSCKVGKEEIVGLTVALERFVTQDPAERHAAWSDALQAIATAAGEIAGATLTVRDGVVPWLVVTLAGGAAAASRVAASLASGRPPILCSLASRHEGVLLFSPMSLAAGDAPIIGGRLREVACE
ncbi:MAG: hypothetical protein ABI369_14800, partial [Acetobacteraceae bacterium]